VEKRTPPEACSIAKAGDALEEDAQAESLVSQDRDLEIEMVGVPVSGLDGGSSTTEFTSTSARTVVR
jgi:hypothetical protein